MCVCVCVCVYLHVHVCVCVCVYIYIYIYLNHCAVRMKLMWHINSKSAIPHLNLKHMGVEQ